MGKAEGKIEKALIKRVKLIGGRIRKSVWLSHRGCPDRRVMVPEGWREHIARVTGTPWPQNPWVECKSGEGDLEDHQVREIVKMRLLGEVVLVIDSLELIDKFFPLTEPSPGAEA